MHSPAVPRPRWFWVRGPRDCVRGSKKYRQYSTVGPWRPSSANGSNRASADPSIGRETAKCIPDGLDRGRRQRSAKLPGDVRRRSDLALTPLDAPLIGFAFHRGLVAERRQSVVAVSLVAEERGIEVEKSDSFSVTFL